jgi:hypothetical protein
MYTTKADKKALVEGGCSDAPGSTASPWIRTPLVPATLSDVESAECAETSRAYVDDPPAPTPAPTPASEAETTEGEVKPVV